LEIKSTKRGNLTLPKHLPILDFTFADYAVQRYHPRDMKETMLPLFFVFCLSVISPIISGNIEISDNAPEVEKTIISYLSKNGKFTNFPTGGFMVNCNHCKFQTKVFLISIVRVPFKGGAVFGKKYPGGIRCEMTIGDTEDKPLVLETKIMTNNLKSCALFEKQISQDINLKFNDMTYMEGPGGKSLILNVP
jgi:hypothetical protein